MSMFRPQILRFDSLPSTNDEVARQAALGANEGLCVIAAEQTAGRGRLQRTWVSPKNAGLYLSVLLRPSLSQQSWPLLTFVAALAVNDALLQCCSLETDIKWPNDILSNGRKICGILAETVETSAGRAVILGIGINLKKSSFPAELESIATSVEKESGQSVEPDDLLESLLDAFGKYYQRLQQLDGTVNIVREVSARSSYASNKRIQVNDGDGSLVGTTRGLESDGSLRVETDDGEVKTIRAGDVTVLRAT
jgi:BirA family transcriptional regulator, biotin operon repressor / biotin---[acetyl-CoA-carboxylase] ligase